MQVIFLKIMILSYMFKLLENIEIARPKAQKTTLVLIFFLETLKLEISRK